MTALHTQRVGTHLTLSAKTMYTQEELQGKSLAELKEIGWRLNTLPDGDRRFRQNWIRAIEPAAEQAGDRAADEFFASNEVNAAKVDPEMSCQSAIVPVAENSPGAEVDIDQTWTPWEKEYCSWLVNAKWCVYQGQNKRIEAFLPTAKTLRLEGMKKGSEYCPIWEVSECTYDLSGLEPLPVCCSSPYAQDELTLMAAISPGAEVDPVSSAIVQAAENYPGVEAEPVSSAIVQAGEFSPGVDWEAIQDQLQEPLLESSPGACDCPFCGAQHALFTDDDYLGYPVIRCRNCSYCRFKNYLGAIRTLEKEAVLVSKLDRTVSPKLAANPIIETVETSPGVESELASKFGRIVYPRPAAKVDPRLSHGAIVQAAENSPGVTQAQEPIECSADGYYFQEPDGRRYMYLRGRRFYMIEPTMQEAVDTNVYGEPDYPEWPDGWLSEPESDRKPLTSTDAGNPAEFGEVLHIAEPSGQLNLLEWDVSEPPDPDDYDLMTDFHAAYDRWQLSSELQEIIHTKNEPTIEGTDTQCQRASEMPRNNYVPSECDSGSYRDGTHVESPHGLEFGKEGDRILAISRNGEGDTGRDLSRKLAQLAPIVPPQAPIAQATQKSPGVGVDLKIGMWVGRRSLWRHIGKILNIYQSLAASGGQKSSRSINRISFISIAPH